VNQGGNWLTHVCLEIGSGGSTLEQGAPAVFGFAPPPQFGMMQQKLLLLIIGLLLRCVDHNA